ncbi:uncharacterized protein B0I36DRAFT_136611 [Microdochium trichocladiopsis]|uniref:Uncharacterized protein n=1 Tax=Microdochium trichocladiopsis TaxID=1682393 RepID=A0A9P8Y3G3_9PEZI|nr:uncharacterized protein B0I36DRAFT_136611 [Microdochium trichocladiopsis]KAH7027237.1 hypothetical protein B0I36DRAFT_136611 [Microdochium trichocladiopsis]
MSRISLQLVSPWDQWDSMDNSGHPYLGSSDIPFVYPGQTAYQQPYQPFGGRPPPPPPPSHALTQAHLPRTFSTPGTSTWDTPSYPTQQDRDYRDHSNIDVPTELIPDVAPPEVLEWRYKLFDVVNNPTTFPQEQWDALWIWIDNLWTPRRRSYLKQDGITHREWKCRYMAKTPLPSKSTGKRKREIRKGYGCNARLLANIDHNNRLVHVRGATAHNHGFEELDATKLTIGVKEWVLRHIQLGMEPRVIDALIRGRDKDHPTAARLALNQAGGMRLDEPSIRNIARKWRWPADKFNMRQSDLFRQLQPQHNTFSFTLQDPETFHRDVCELAEAAHTTDELNMMLKQRKEERLEELNRKFEATGAKLARNPYLGGEPKHWDNMAQLFRDKSYDALVRYFATHVDDDGELEGGGAGQDDDEDDAAASSDDED